MAGAVDDACYVIDDHYTRDALMISLKFATANLISSKFHKHLI